MPSFRSNPTGAFPPPVDVVASITVSGATPSSGRTVLAVLTGAGADGIAGAVSYRSDGTWWPVGAAGAPLEVPLPSGTREISLTSTSQQPVGIDYQDDAGRPVVVHWVKMRRAARQIRVKVVSPAERQATISWLGSEPSPAITEPTAVPIAAGVGPTGGVLVAPLLLLEGEDAAAGGAGQAGPSGGGLDYYAINRRTEDEDGVSGIGAGGVEGGELTQLDLAYLRLLDGEAALGLSLPGVTGGNYEETVVWKYTEGEDTASFEASGAVELWSEPLPGPGLGSLTEDSTVAGLATWHSTGTLQLKTVAG